MHQDPAPSKGLLARLFPSGGILAGSLSWLRPVADAMGELVGRGGSASEPAVTRRRRERFVPPPNPFAPLGDYVYRHEVLERLVPVAVCVLLVAAAIVSSLPAVEGVAAQAQPTYVLSDAGAAPAQLLYGDGDGPSADPGDLYLGDGSISNTMQNTGVATDAASLLVTYTVQPGDTLTKVAQKFGLVTATVYWANKPRIPNPNSLGVGQQLIILPVDGILISVTAKDTLASLAARYNVTEQAILDTNYLTVSTLTKGMLLIIPGATMGPVPRVSTTTARRGWLWPVGEPNYVSQYFWSGHHALDIAAPLGTPVYAAVSGTVVMAGWRSYSGGGNVIWVEVNSKLYVTYNHLSRWYVKAGQRVVAGQRIGAVGQSGNATGPHLHFEVWLGYPWALGTVADAVNPCIYLQGC